MSEVPERASGATGEIRLTGAVPAEIRAHGAAAYPAECCGALLGRDATGARSVVRVIRIDNARTDSAHDRFLVTDADYLRAEREAARAGLDLLGFYHSHPDHPARPSQFDLDHAFPWFSYVILAVAKGTPGRITSWVLGEDRVAFLEQPVREALPGDSIEPFPGAESTCP